MEFLCKSPKAVPRGSIEIGFDIFCDEAALRHYWPLQAEAALQCFDSYKPQPMQ